MSIKTRTPLYAVWRGMRVRCYNPSHKSYRFYGGIGIAVCQQWINSFECFKEWAMSNGYRKGLTIDRYPNKSGNYEPGNCRWATWTEQERNRKDNISPITAFGETKRIWDWLEDARCKVSRNTLLLRLKTGRDSEWAMTEPYRAAPPRRKPHSEATKLKISEKANERAERKRLWRATQGSIN